MRSFIYRTFLLILMFATTLLVGELYVRQYPNPARDKHQWMLRHSQEVETLVLGSSHTFYGVQPALLGPHTYSLAQVSQTYRYDLYLLQHYPMPRLRTVILPFSYFSLYDDLETMGDEPFTAVRYRIYMDCDIHPWLSTWHLECMQGAAFKEKIRSLWHPATMTWDSLGYGTNYTLQQRPSDWDNGQQRAERNTHVHGTETPASLELNRGYLRDIMNHCQERGIRLILLSTPCTESFCRHQSREQLAMNDHVLGQLLRQHPEVVRLDLTEDERFRRCEQGYPDFYDADHLSTVGAERLTRLLRPYITR